MDTTVSVVSQIAEYLVVPIKRKVGYLVSYKSNLKNLINEVEKLEEMRTSLQLCVDSARRNGEIIESDVMRWMVKVYGIEEEVNEFLASSANKRLSIAGGQCFQFRSVYRLSKEAKRKAIIIALLKADGMFGIVSHPLPPPVIEYNSSYEVFESRMAVLNGAVEALNDDDINIIGICGFGGVGKTELVKEVAKIVMRDKTFDEVVMAVVSQSPDLIKIQGEIADTLGLILDKVSITGRAALLYNRLTYGKKILVVLDDVWAGLNLFEIGIPLRNQSGGCKVVLTSRSQDVCSLMGTQKIFKLEILSEEEAWYLFRRKVGDSVDVLPLYPVARNVANECQGLPLAIITIARALRNKSMHVWEDALQQLRHSAPNNIKGMHEIVYSSLELSYNCLVSEEAKTCFLLCCLFPEGANISIDILMSYGMGLRLFENVNTLKKRRERLHAIVGHLKDAALLLDGVDQESLTMHDVVRDCAISIASKDKHSFLIKTGVELHEWPIIAFQNSTAISLRFKVIHELPYMSECPKLQILVLECSHLSLNIPEMFFQGMRELKVLDLCGFDIPRLPISLQFLTGLRTLYLSGCKLEDLSNLGKLEKLEILSFNGSDIRELPKEVGQLTHLRWLDLTGCDKLTRVPPHVLSCSCLVQLEFLYMKNTNVRWEVDRNDKERDNASIVELSSLSHLNTLEVHIPNVKQLPEDLLIKALIRFKISIGSHFEAWEDYPSSRVLKLMGTPLTDGVNVLLKRAEVIYLHGLKDLKKDLPNIDKESFLDCKFLKVEHCDEIECLINTMGWVPHVVTPEVEELCLRQLPAGSFGNLRVVEVANCRLYYLFSSSNARCLAQLQELIIKECKVMEEVVAKDERVEEEDADKVVFPQLSFLKLACLPNFTSFRPKRLSSNGVIYSPIQPLFNETVLFPSLEVLSICGLDNLREICCDQFPAESFSKLRVVTFVTYEKLSNIDLSNLLERLQKLEELTIMRCGLKEDLLELEGLVSEKVDARVLSKLTELTLWGKLKLMHSLWEESPRTFVFPNLTKLEFWNCYSLRNLNSSSMVECLPQLQFLTINSCKMMEEIFAKGKEEEATDNILLPQLKSLVLADLPNLKSFCSWNCTIEFLSLETLTLVRCPRINAFISGPISTLKSKTNSGGFEEQGVLESDEDIPTAQTLFDEKVSFPSLVELKLSFMVNLKVIWNSQLPAKSFFKLKVVVVEKCDQLLKVVPSNMVQRLQNLEDLSIKECGSLHGLFDLTELAVEGGHVPLSQFKMLRLVHLPKLIHIWKEDRRGMEDELTNLRYLFSPSIAKGLVQLQVLEITGCEMVEEIIADQGDVIDKIVFEQVTSLILKDLLNLSTFCRGSYIFEWPSLKTLKVGDCPKLETLSFIFNAQKLQTFSVKSEDVHQEGHHDSSIQHPFNGQVAVPLEALNLCNLENLKEICKDPQGIIKFQNLSSLTVYKCDCLRNLFSPSMARGLLRLQLLEINSCKMMEEIVAINESGEAATTDKIVFPEVNTLKLEHLPNLKWFCSFYCAFEWPSLKTVRVEDCPQMQTFSSGSLSTPKLRKVEVSDNQWEWKGDLENTIECLFTGEVPFSTEEKWCINCPDDLKGILDTKLHANSFGNLKVLEARCIDEKWNVFLSNFLPRSHKLEELFVENCEFLEEVFDLERFARERKALFFIQLRKLTLWDLPRLMNIWNKDPNGILGLQKLREFYVLRCGCLRNLISTSVARSLVQLEVLKVHSCDMMEEIVASETVGVAAGIKKIELPQLKHLELVGLSNLINFHSRKCNFEMPFLETLRIECCPLLRTFTAGFLSMQKSVTVDEGLELTLEGGDPSMLMQRDFNEKVVFPRIKKLHLICLQNFEEIWHGQIPDGSFCELQVLEVDTCSKLLHVIPWNLLSRLENLEKLTVQNCDLLEDVIDLDRLITGESHAVAAVLSRVGELVLTHLPKLMHLVNKEFAGVTVFPNIQILKVKGCGCLRNIFSASIARCLMQLKVVEIADCKIMEHIIVKEKEVVGKISFPLLYSLVLEDLPSLTTFSEGSSSFEFPSLVTLTISHCTKMKSFSSGFCGMSDTDATMPFFPSDMLIRFQKLEKLTVERCDSQREIFELEGLVTGDIHGALLPWLSELVLTHLPKVAPLWIKEPAGIPLFENLRSLQVICCNGLANLFSLSTARNLKRLQTLKIFGCELMEEVITVGEGETMDNIVFPELKCLILKHLPSLTCFFRGSNTFEWPLLGTMRVMGIPKMKNFALGSQSTPNLKAIYVTFLGKCWNGDLNATIEHLYTINESYTCEVLGKEQHGRSCQTTQGWLNSFTSSSQGQALGAESSSTWKVEAVDKSSSRHLCKAKGIQIPKVSEEQEEKESIYQKAKWLPTLLPGGYQSQALAAGNTSKASTVNHRGIPQGEIEEVEEEAEPQQLYKLEESQIGETSEERRCTSANEKATLNLSVSRYQHGEFHETASKDEDWTARMTTRMATLMMLMMITTRMEQASSDDHEAARQETEAESK